MTERDLTYIARGDRANLLNEGSRVGYEVGSKEGAQAERAAIVAWLRDAIAQGYPTASAGKRAKCEHDRYYFEECIACYDEFLIGKLEAIESGSHLTSDGGEG